MTYVKAFAVVATINITLLFLAFNLFPAVQPHLTEEDQLIEYLSAAFFLGAALLALYGLFTFRNRPKGSLWFLALLLVVGVVGALDEVSYGERLSDTPTIPVRDVLRGHDGVHDVLAMTRWKIVKEINEGNGMVVLGLASGLLLVAAVMAFGLRSQLATFFSVVRRTPHYLLFFIGIVLVTAAQVLDLGLVDFASAAFFEEVFEMNTGLALAFSAVAALATRTTARQYRMSSRQL